MCNAQGSTLFKPNGSLERILRIYLVSTSNVLRGSLCNNIEFKNLIKSGIFMIFEMFFESGILAVSVSRDPLA